MKKQQYVSILIIFACISMIFPSNQNNISDITENPLASATVDEDPNFARINYVHFYSDANSPFVEWTMKSLYGNYEPPDYPANGWYNSLIENYSSIKIVIKPDL